MIIILLAALSFLALVSLLEINSKIQRQVKATPPYITRQQNTSDELSICQQKSSGKRLLIWIVLTPALLFLLRVMVLSPHVNNICFALAIASVLLLPLTILFFVFRASLPLLPRLAHAILSVAGRTLRCAGTALKWIVAAPFILILLLPFILLFGLPIVLIVCAIGFKLCLFILAVSWCLNDFKNDVADEVVRRQKSAK